MGENQRGEMTNSIQTLQHLGTPNKDDRGFEEQQDELNYSQLKKKKKLKNDQCSKVQVLEGRVEKSHWGGAFLGNGLMPKCHGQKGRGNDTFLSSCH